MKKRRHKSYPHIITASSFSFFFFYETDVTTLYRVTFLPFSSKISISRTDSGTHTCFSLSRAYVDRERVNSYTKKKKREEGEPTNSSSPDGTAQFLCIIQYFSPEERNDAIRISRAIISDFFFPHPLCQLSSPPAFFLPAVRKNAHAEECFLLFVTSSPPNPLLATSIHPPSKKVSRHSSTVNTSRKLDFSQKGTLNSLPYNQTDFPPRQSVIVVLKGPNVG